MRSGGKTLAKTTKVRESGRLALACGGCGEIILFLGPERDWYEPEANGSPRSFPCGGCGARLTLANRLVGDAPTGRVTHRRR